VQGLLHILSGVAKPARYLGGEVNEVRKDWDGAQVRVALAFPDMYEVAMSHQGLHILYDVLNRRPDTLAERAYAVWPDLEAELCRTGRTLFTLESKRPLRDFDVVGFTLQYELSYPTVLCMLDLAGIPLRSRDRTDADPIVLGGGPGAFSPEPVADFFDAFLVGEGEDAVHEIVEAVRAAKTRGREAVLEALAYVGGVYVPRFFEPLYQGDRLVEMRHHGPGPAVVRKRVVYDLDRAPFPGRPLVANIEAVHDRVPVELQRGCMRACRFCQVGYIARPNRQRSPQRVFELASRGLTTTGKDEVGFLSLSAGDYGCLNPLLEDFFRRFAPEMVGASLPSLRTETLTPELAEQVKRVRKSGFTIAPEAGSARMRRVINKGNDEEDLLRAVRATFGAGWNLIKLYFMIGLPFERDEDVLAIADLCQKALAEGRKLRSNARITASASTFIPKPHTPFQFAPMIGREETRRRQGILWRALRGSGVDFKGHDSDQSLVEGFLSRADRRMANVIERVYRMGARLDGWSEHFRLERWQRAMAEEGLSPEHQLGPRLRGDCLPWDHIDCLMPKSWMWEDYQAAQHEVFVDDCALAARPKCYDCGVCDHRVVKNRIYREESYLAQLPTRVAEPWQAPAPAPALRVGARARGHRVRLHYQKGPRAALFGHLDTVRVFERALRRAGIALVHTLGYNPKPRMTFSPACPLGVESEAEYIDFEICEPLSAQEVGERLAAQLPNGFEVHCVEALAPAAPAISSLVEGYVLRFELPETMSEDEIEAQVLRLHEAPALSARRVDAKRRRDVDLKALIPQMAVTGPHRVKAVVRWTQQGSARPAEILKAVFGLSGEEARLVRVVRERAILGGDAPGVERGAPVAVELAG
jgi:radical SAM family uncharacterized protein/radical SAM-linked protein